MLKNNKKTWTIGYVKLPSEFDLTDPIEHAKAYYFTNLKPMWSDEMPRMEDFEIEYLDEINKMLSNQ